jgi:hypothetical protein
VTAVAPGTPASAVFAEVVNSDARSFLDDPSKAISHASTRAAQAQLEGRLDAAKFWLALGLAFCELVGREPGAVLADLRGRYGDVPLTVKHP